MNNNLTYSATGRALTEFSEGFRSTAYQDSGGVWTIGYGHTKGVTKGMTCTQAQADQWLADDVKEASDAVNKLVQVPLNQNQFDALVDFVFNLGIGNFQGSTLLKLLNQGDYAGASNEFPKWNHDNGKVVAGLTIRRLAEQKLFNQPIVTPIQEVESQPQTASVVQQPTLVSQLQTWFNSVFKKQ